MPAPPELLRSVDIFASLSDRDLERLAHSFKQSDFKKGDVIATEGQRGVGFFVIAEGTVDFSHQGERIGSGGPGNYFGEVALIDDGPRSATVTAATDVVTGPNPAQSGRSSPLRGSWNSPGGTESRRTRWPAWR